MKFRENISPQSHLGKKNYQNLKNEYKKKKKKKKKRLNIEPLCNIYKSLVFLHFTNFH